MLSYFKNHVNAFLQFFLFFLALFLHIATRYYNKRGDHSPFKYSRSNFSIISFTFFSSSIALTFIFFNNSLSMFVVNLTFLFFSMIPLLPILFHPSGYRPGYLSAPP